MDAKSQYSRPPARLIDLLAVASVDHPDTAAVVHHERQITFADLWTQTMRLTHRLEQLELSPGSRVGILWENTIEYVAAFFAATAAGLVVVPLDTSLAPEKLGFILTDCEAEVLVVQARFRRHLGRILSGNDRLRLIICDKPFKTETGAAVELLDDILSSDIQVAVPTLTDSADDSDRELAAIFYTSGSTGDSKGVMLSHRNLVSNTIATVEYLRLKPGESVMVILPFYYIYGNSLLLTHAAVGGTLVIDNRFMYPEVVLDEMETRQVNGFSGVPSHFMILLHNSTFAKRKFQHLRYVTQAGGSMAPEVTRRLMDALPEKEIWIMYGQTEAAPRVTYLPPERLEEKLGSIGIAVPGVKIEIVDEHGREVPVGETGELSVIGDNVMLGYYNQPEDTAEVLRDGRLLTGDLARRDEDGYLYITGRRREIIKSGGNRVSAKEVEERILEHESVAEATVFGIPDDILGEAIKTVIVLKSGMTADPKDIQTHCQKVLAVHKVPKFVEFRDALPKLQSGKVDKLTLKAQSV